MSDPRRIRIAQDVLAGMVRVDLVLQSRSVRHAAAAVAWSLAFVYIAAEIVTALAWSTPYSFQYDTISDLGVTACTVDLCSPRHLVMNATFVALGLLTIVGAVLFRETLTNGYRRKWILSLAVLVGLSTAATGLMPSNDNFVLHMLAVVPGFVSRHIVLILLAVWLWQQRRVIAVWSATCALSGVVGAVLFLGSAVRIGISERLVLYPLPAFMAVTGVAVLATMISRRFRPMRARVR
ncbi:DUF998 domain-containing protein [Antrihabitans stalagmiti]|uniref:DUF998 domain-containing protein n=1 Tax=Antrihabitans stalagmiti TaxID=2799499 RepID=UPI001F28B2D6|nr:DUF998 domain-containing protein [Antrihabitans stalagmiti]